MYAIFQQLPKSVKKTIRYILQDVQSLEKLERIEKTIHYYIQKRKKELKKNDSFKQIR
ncbi:LytR family transcriptional regulator [Geobacillus thermodenitrificans]|jgi:hypothetical protein|nr:LytR family transcriptional regulator [Geobacillus thermodenitrificans]PTR45863.1 LytR family transcriptional regulator [Geobacillus thermodenitrificans]